MSREKAKELLAHWFFTVAISSAEQAVSDGRDEIASIVDEIVDAAVNEAIARMRSMAHEGGR